jgi:ubiquinone/menaquinone biosynthesis C-methylase UbiE
MGERITFKQAIGDSLSARDMSKADNPPVLERKFSRAQTERVYSRMARVYDLWASFTESKAIGRALDLARIQDGSNILEVAVGTGIAFKELAEHNTHGKNEGIDISPAMLSAAARRMKSHEPNSYHLQVADAGNLPFADSGFDLVVCNYMFDLLPESDFAEILKEFYRVLRPSGEVVIVTMAFGRKWYNHFWHWVARNFPSLLTNCRPVLIENYASATGFRDVRMESVSQNTFPSQIITALK